MANKLDPKVLAKAFALVTLFIDITGYVWHGLLQQPSIVEVVYPGFWSNPGLLLFGLVGTLVYAYVVGYVFAAAYNWSGKK